MEAVFSYGADYCEALLRLFHRKEKIPFEVDGDFVAECVIKDIDVGRMMITVEIEDDELSERIQKKLEEDVYKLSVGWQGDYAKKSQA
jgi:hypothetical protein